MKTTWTAILIASLIGVVGCEKPAPTDNVKPKTVVKGETEAHDHSGWWCEEHGVKEDECSICSKAVFKKLKPDEICPNHPDRAKAQCFICDPDLWEKSKAVYKAKYGVEPPAPEDNMPAKK